MKINFTKKEYRSLVELLEIASWVTTSHIVDANDEPKKYNDLIQKIYAFSKEMECLDIIEHSKELDGFYPTREFEEDSEVRQYIEDFEEDTFWAELISKLSGRDVLNKYNIKSLSELETDQRIDALYESDVKWEEEINRFGLERLGVVALKSVK